MTTPNYQQIDAEADEARKRAEKQAAQAGLTGWDCTNVGLEAQKKVWRAYKAASPRCRTPASSDDLDKLNLNSLDD